VVLEFAFVEQIAKFGVVSRFIFLRLGVVHIRTLLTLSYHQFAIRSLLIKGRGDEHRRETLSKEEP
jgi:hypothetical protein